MGPPGRNLLGRGQEGWLATEFAASLAPTRIRGMAIGHRASACSRSSSSLGSGPEGDKQLATIRANRPHPHYVDGSYRGYFILDLTRERLQADFYAVATVLDRTTKERFEKLFITESFRNHLIEASTPASPAKGPDPAPV